MVCYVEHEPIWSRKFLKEIHMPIKGAIIGKIAQPNYIPKDHHFMRVLSTKRFNTYENTFWMRS